LSELFIPLTVKHNIALGRERLAGILIRFFTSLVMYSTTWASAAYRRKELCFEHLSGISDD